MKKTFLFLMIAAFSSAMMMNSCSSGGEKQAKEQAVTQEETTAPAVVDENAAMMARGEEIYKTKCIACHQADGNGLPGAFPSLVGSKFLLETPALAVSQALNGSLAVAADRTVTYPAPMPPQLDNKEDAVAAVNYVRNNFGNEGGNITLEDVADVVINPREQ